MRSGLKPQVQSSIFSLQDCTVLETKEIEIVVNGQPRRTPAGQSLTELLARLDVDPERVAIELNRSIIRRERWNQTEIGPGSALEIVQFVGGG
jgi:thiamine biosynthesis protein ThiS